MIGAVKNLSSNLPKPPVSIPVPIPVIPEIPVPSLPRNLGLPELPVPLLPRNLLASVFVHADGILSFFSQNYKLLHLLRSFITSVFLFFLSLLPAFLSAFTLSHNHSHNYPPPLNHDYSSPKAITPGPGGGVSRALYQLLLIMSDIPVSSRKYQVVRSLAEKIIEDNLSDGNQALKDVNCAVLSASFSRTLSQLESAVVEHERWGGGETMVGPRPAVRESESFICDLANLFVKGMGYFGRAAWRFAMSGMEAEERSEMEAEKLAAEVLWLAQKMAASGCVEEGVRKWASASHLAMLALSAEQRLQGSLVKASAFLIKEAKEVSTEGDKNGTVRKLKMKILITWLPLLCRANNGIDEPVLNVGARLEVERTLEEIIQSLEAEEQELVLSHWLHHFTYCPASDWPNLRSSYTRWYNASRRSLLTAAPSPETV